MSTKRKVLVTGGAGYVGSVLVPKLLAVGHEVTVLDLYIYGDTLAEVADDPRLRQIRGDIRDPQAVRKALEGCDTVVHLACISNDPSFALNPELGRSINHEAFRPLVRAAKAAGVNRFVYASSSSVYGIKEGEVTEELTLEPLTDYSRFKAICEEELNEAREPDFVTLVIRPATICGYSPRQRLDLTVNILTNHAVNKREITLFGGTQKRPNIHIADIADLYVKCVEYPDEMIDGKVFNAGYENHTLSEIATMVQEVVGEVAIRVARTDDLRSYHVSSEKIRRELGFVPRRTITEAIQDLVAAFEAGHLPNALDDPRYFNLRCMQQVELR